MFLYLLYKLKTANNIIPNKNITNRLPKRNNVKYSETYLQDINKNLFLLDYLNINLYKKII